IDSTVVTNSIGGNDFISVMDLAHKTNSAIAANSIVETHSVTIPDLSGFNQLNQLNPLLL
ncbi:hypothetical protein LOAG_12934, partial [Loa loa]